MAIQTVLELKDITKRFGSTVALAGVSFDLRPGEVHALVGENGAGKSTLINILGGVHQPTSGTIFVDGEATIIPSPKQAQGLGISVVHQEMVVCEDLTVAENIFLGREFKNGFFLDKSTQIKEAEEALRRVNAQFSANEVVRRLSTANKQMVEITMAISSNAKCIIFDEPTSSITENDAKNLFAVIKKLCKEGVAVIYISHRMEEILELADRVTILRDGKAVGTMEKDEIDQNKIVAMMVGRELTQFYQRKNKPQDEILFEVEHISGQKVNDSSFYVKKGEIVGFAGLVGAGRTEMMREIFGLDPRDTGIIKVAGKPVNITSPSTAVENGVVYLPEDRKQEGLFLRMSVRDNITIVSVREFIRNFRVNRRKENELAHRYTEPLRLKATMDQPVQSLSGGNQQKVLMARWLNVADKVLILDEPTRGIDVGSKADIYRILDEASGKGYAVIIVSSEMQEIVGMCDRVYVMHDYHIVGVLEGDDITQVNIMKMAAGGM